MPSKVHLDLPDELLEQLRVIAKREDRPITNLVRQYVKRGLAADDAAISAGIVERPEEREAS